MTKTIYAGREVPHIFATNRDAVARNPSRSLYCEGGTLYSYRDSAPIASWFGDKVLINTRTYSVTTSKHQSWASYATHHLEKIYLPDMAQIARNSPSPIRAAEYISERQAEIDDLRGKLSRARSDWRKSQLNQEIAGIETACAFVWNEWAKKKGDWRNAGKVKAKEDKARAVARYTVSRARLETGVEHAVRLIAKARYEMAQEDRGWQLYFVLYNCAEDIGRIDEMGARHGSGVIATATFRHAAKIMGKQWAKDCERLALQIQKMVDDLQPEIAASHTTCDAKVTADNAEKVARWLAGENVRFQGDTLCRVSADTVETSHGARVPLGEALQFAELAKTCRNVGKGVNLKGRQIGPYRGNSIDAEGNMTIGCHHIKWQAIAECVARYEAGISGMIGVQEGCDVVTVGRQAAGAPLPAPPREIRLVL